MVRLTADEIEAFEERAGILEFDAGMPRGRAERVSLAMVLASRDGNRLSESACAIATGNDRVTA